MKFCVHLLPLSYLFNKCIVRNKFWKPKNLLSISNLFKTLRYGIKFPISYYLTFTIKLHYTIIGTIAFDAPFVSVHPLYCPLLYLQFASFIKVESTFMSNFLQSHEKYQIIKFSNNKFLLQCHLKINIIFL